MADVKNERTIEKVDGVLRLLLKRKGYTHKTNWTTSTLTSRQPRGTLINN